MLRFLVVSLIVFLGFGLPALAFDCAEDEDISLKVRHIGVLCEAGKAEWLLDQLAKYPEEALCSLVKQLGTTPVKAVWPWEWHDKLQATNQMWRIRALRFLTCGLEFTGVTRYNPRFEKETTEDYWRMVAVGDYERLKPGDRLRAWFTGRPEGGVDYIAPVDAQKDIIRQWRHWYATNRTGNFGKKCYAGFNWYHHPWR